MNRDVSILALSLVLIAVSGCSEQAADGPPTVRLDDSVCDQCNMIISDERWSTATIIEGDRGPEPRIFDDFNCQANYEGEHPDLTILARWSHSYSTREWLSTEKAVFLISPDLRSPMGSNIAAFASESEAETTKADFTGDIMTFDAAWQRLGITGEARPQP